MSSTASPAIHVTTIGDGARPVVFLHGLFGQGKNFTTVAKALSAALPDVSCLLLDLPNHGRSTWTDDTGYPAIAAVLADRIAQLSPHRPVTLIGHSMGGKAAMMIALTRPELVERLVVVDIAPYDSSATGSSNAPLVAAMAALDLSTLASRPDADAQLAGPVADPVVRGFLLQNLRRSSGANPTWSWQMNLDLLGRELDTIAGWPELDLAPYPGPVLWVAGQKSNYIIDEHRAPMKALFPRARLVTVKDSGHWVHAEQPEAFVTIVGAFLREPANRAS